MKQLKVALIGAGFMGRAHVLAYATARSTGAAPAALVPVVVVDAALDRARSFAEQFDIPESVADWQSVVGRPDIDVVDICTPPQFHEEIAVAALTAGKHVFCEKPISNDTAQAFAMAEVARQAGVIAQVGFNYRHTPAIAFVRQLLAAGRLGTPLQIRASYLQDSGFSADPHRWRAAKATGGSGTVGDIGSHLIDLSESLCGDIVKVAARMRSLSRTPADGWASEGERIGADLVDDGAVWLAEFANGVIGSFAVSSYSSGSKNRLAFGLDTTTGAVDFNWNDREVFRVSYVSDPPDHSGFREVYTNDRHPHGPWHLAGLGLGYLDVSGIQFLQFIQAVEGSHVDGSSFADAAHVQQVASSISEAAVSQQWVDVPRRYAELAS